MGIITIRALDGTEIKFRDEVFSSGGMKDAYWGYDGSYVVLFFRDKQDYNTLDRLKTITDLYYSRIFKRVGGEYWKKLFCWPTHIVEYGGKLGIVVPKYENHFFFKYGSVKNDMLGIKGNEKEGKWFASASNQNRFLDRRERGDWRSYFRILILISRAVKRLHAAGLAHSDLSYKNVLIDPNGGNACIIDIDSLVVPGKFAPDVVGTPDFIAPEVMTTRGLPLGHPQKKLPNIDTDKHALAVLIYMYLLYRHPLRGGKVHDLDPQKDEVLSMGANALFIEHPQDRSNRPNLDNISRNHLPWADVNCVPYAVCGPYLKTLFDKAFISALQKPHARPGANEWEVALVKTLDLMQPCENNNCDQKWFVFSNSRSPRCPFCGAPYTRQLPILNLYSARTKGKYIPDNHRIMVYNDQYLYWWHCDRTVFPNERLKEEQTKPVGYFVFHQGKWLLVNLGLEELKDVTNGKKIPIKDAVELTDDKKILFSDQAGGRLAVVQIVN